MPYTPGGIVTDSDYNNLAYETGLPPIVIPVTAKVGDIFGVGFRDYGYGGNSINTGVASLPIINTNDTIQSATGAPGSPDEWLNLRSAFADCATHQGTIFADPLPGVGFLEDGDIVSAGITNDFDNLNSAANNLALATNRNTVNLAHLSIATIGNSTRTTAWSSFVRHEFTVNFGSEDNARHFFNTGGEIIIGASRSGGSATPQNTDWTNLLAANSPYTFTPADYFALTLIFEDKLSVSSGGLYSLNNWAIRAKADTITGIRGAKGSVLRIRSDFTDGHNNAFFDSVDGTLLSTVQENRSVAIFSRPTPTFATTQALTVGS